MTVCWWIDLLLLLAEVITRSVLGPARRPARERPGERFRCCLGSFTGEVRRPWLIKANNWVESHDL